MIRAYSSWKSKISISKYKNIYIWVSINDHPYSINSGYLLFFETTIMEKTADLAMVQKTNIDTLHKEGKSQRVITERCGCLQSAVSKHIKCKVDWKEDLGRKRCTSKQGWPQAWEYSQAKADSNTWRASQAVDWSWSQCIKSHHAQTSSGKGLPRHFWTRDNVRSVLPGLWRKITQWSKVLFSDESQFCISFGNKVPESGGRVERHRIHVAWSPVWSFHSQWWFGLPCHLLVLVHCVFWSPQSTQPSTRKF